MDFITIFFWIFSVLFFIITLKKKRQLAIKNISKAKLMMKSMLTKIISIIFLIGFIQAVIPIENFQILLNNSNTLISTLLAAIIGSITIIPAFVAFPLVSSFIEAGINYVPASSFLTTLTMVGLATYPIEAKQFGKKFAILRNIISFAVALLIALAMGVILS